MKKAFLVLILVAVQLLANAQITQREHPAEWVNLVEGARFLDRFQPIPPVGKLSKGEWGTKEVLIRYIDNGIEEKEWSYWGGNILEEEGKYHLFICRWPENAQKGHMEWPGSTVVRAVADNSLGPFRVVQEIGPGHNPEVYPLKKGGFIVYVIDGYYYADKISGPWEYRRFEFNARDRRIPAGLTNLTFAQREDGSYIMVCRGGGIWFSKDGESEFNLVTEESVYPPYDGSYEDPVIWRTPIQYHMIVHDWYGRIAYYMRSRDGINWKLDPGEAYVPGIAVYEDGTREDWFKFERIKILQDSYGRAVQANFAVIDTLKHYDHGSDNHSSKNIAIPLTAGRLITILGDQKITPDTKTIPVKIEAEKGFDPIRDIDIASLRFGAPEEVNYGGGGKVIASQREGRDLILTFDGSRNGLSDDNFTAKLLGKTSEGKLLFGYARLPWLDYLQPALSARLPKISQYNNDCKVEVEVQNFGQTISKESEIEVEYKSGRWKTLVVGTVKSLEPFEKTILILHGESNIVNNQLVDVRVSIKQPGQSPAVLNGIISVALYAGNDEVRGSKYTP